MLKIVLSVNVLLKLAFKNPFSDMFEVVGFFVSFKNMLVKAGS